MSGDREPEIRKTRLETLLVVYKLMGAYKQIAENTRVSDTKACQTVEDYLLERRAVVQRHKIPDRIQRPKVAALMAASIVKFRPLVDFYPDDATGGCSESDSWLNERFSIYHGLAVCAEGCPDESLKRLLSNPHFESWVSKFADRLKSGLSPDALIQAFETVCLSYFPENLDHHALCDGE
jgi:hypothetical protein